MNVNAVYFSSFFCDSHEHLHHVSLFNFQCSVFTIHVRSDFYPNQTDSSKQHCILASSSESQMGMHQSNRISYGMNGCVSQCLGRNLKSRFLYRSKTKHIVGQFRMCVKHLFSFDDRRSSTKQTTLNVATSIWFKNFWSKNRKLYSIHGVLSHSILNLCFRWWMWMNPHRCRIWDIQISIHFSCDDTYFNNVQYNLMFKVNFVEIRSLCISAFVCIHKLTVAQAYSAKPPYSSIIIANNCFIFILV